MVSLPLRRPGTVRAATRSAPTPLRVPGLADFNTQHPYPNRGEPPAGAPPRARTLPNVTDPGRARGLYRDRLLTNGGRDGVGADVQRQVHDRSPARRSGAGVSTHIHLRAAGRVSDRIAPVQCGPLRDGRPCYKSPPHREWHREQRVYIRDCAQIPRPKTAGCTAGRRRFSAPPGQPRPAEVRLCRVRRRCRYEMTRPARRYATTASDDGLARVLQGAPRRA